MREYVTNFTAYSLCYLDISYSDSEPIYARVCGYDTMTSAFQVVGPLPGFIYIAFFYINCNSPICCENLFAIGAEVLCEYFLTVDYV